MMSWWNHRPLRFRLALWYGVGGTVLLAIFSAVIYGYVALQMGQPLDHELREDLAVVRQHLQVGSDGQLRWDGQTVTKDAEWSWENPWFELWDGENRLVQRLWSLDDSRVKDFPFAPVRSVEAISVFEVAKDIPLRVLSVPFSVPGQETKWTIRVMKIHEPLADPLRALLGIITVSLPLVVGLLVLGGYFITRYWLKPLDLMAERAEQISAEDLAQRLPVGDSQNEIGRLGSAFNVTLARLEDSFTALDRFVGDASHELRTPLTTLRSVGEVALRKLRTPQEYQEIIGSMLEEAQRLHRLVDRLLELASAEGGAKSLQREQLRLDQLVTTCVNEIGILAEQKEQHLVITAMACSLQTDPVLLRQALQNLIDNAMKYSPKGAVIRINVEQQGGECRVAVTDEGPGISPEHLARLADRFYRVGDSRVREQGGFGLGLALTKAYMRVLGGRMECVPGERKGSCFRLILPVSTET